MCSYIPSADGRGTLEVLSLNENGLSIVSVRRNPFGTNSSDWIEKVFGSQAYIGERTPNMTAPRETFRSQFQLPLHAQRPVCSIELLGFVRLGPPPFLGRFRGTLVSGEASLQIENSTVPWSCFYRANFESWRTSPTLALSVVYFCPVPQNIDCNQLQEMDISSRAVGHLSMTTHNRTWDADFEAAAIAGPPVPRPNDYGLGNVIISQPTACLAIPYATSHDNKKIVNDALVFEWVRYYATLGFNVMIYDKNGAHRDAIYTDAYGLSQKQHGRDWLNNVDYHPYTVFGLLTKDHTDLKYDNTKFGNDIVFLDDDKTATLTHCRFEAKTLYNSDNVLVADFDEFLHCPSAALNYESQRSYMNTLMATYRGKEIDELVFLQVWVAANLHDGKYVSILDCVRDHVNRTVSIIDCYGGFKHNNGGFFVGKSIQLGHKCPVTNFHNSCHSSDCICTSAYSGLHSLMKTMGLHDRCYFLHLSTNPNEYVSHPPSNETLLYMAGHKSELTQILENIEATVVPNRYRT